MRAALAAGFLAVGFAVPLLLVGAGTAAAGPADACAMAQRSCAAQCDTAYPAKPDDMAHVGCLTRCSWDATACAAQRALEDTQATLERDVKPWLSDQATRWLRFWDGFRNAPPDAPSRPGERAVPPRSTPPAPKSDADRTSL